MDHSNSHPSPLFCIDLQYARQQHPESALRPAATNQDGQSAPLPYQKKTDHEAVYDSRSRQDAMNRESYFRFVFRPATSHIDNAVYIPNQLLHSSHYRHTAACLAHYLPVERPHVFRHCCNAVQNPITEIGISKRRRELHKKSAHIAFRRLLRPQLPSCRPQVFDRERPRQRSSG